MLSNRKKKNKKGKYHYLDYISLPKLQKLIAKLMVNGLDKPVYIFYPDIAQLWVGFISFFELLPAAGGLVVGPDKRVLMIKRNGKWDLPKGKLDGKESIAAGAAREVREETGIKGIKIKQPLLTTYHVYTIKKRWILKPTYWFEMSSKKVAQLFPQAEEGIELAVWADKAEVDIYLDNAYKSITKVVKQYRKKLKTA